MKSFIQYITEIVTDAPSKHIEHEYRTTDFPKTKRSKHATTIHDYKYEGEGGKPPNSHLGWGADVEIHTTHHDTHSSSHFNFKVGGLERRTGESNPKQARTVLKQAVHAGSHHLRTEKPKYFSFDVNKKERVGRSESARKNIYHKIMHRLSDSHGYELHNKKDHPTHDSWSKAIQTVTYKRVDKKK